MFFSSVRMTHIGEADDQNYKLDYPKADLQILYQTVVQLRL